MNTIKIVSALVAFILIIAASIGCASLSRSAANGDIKGIKQFLAEGKNINTIDKYGWTPLIWGVYYGQTNAVKFLLQKGAKPNIQTNKHYGAIKLGSTALMVAAYYGHKKIVKALLSKGANKNLTNSDGETALDIAEKYEFNAIANLLETGTDRTKKRPGRKKKEFIEKYLGEFPGAIPVKLFNGGTIVGEIIAHDKNTVTIKTLFGKIKKIKKENILWMLKKE